MTTRFLSWFLLALLVSAGFARLGLWQWQRGADKDALAARIVAAEGQPSLSLAESLALGEEARFSSVTVHGRLLPPTLLLDNQIRDGRVGVLVANRLQIDASEEKLLVIRGWMPLTDGIRALPQIDMPLGTHSLHGHLDSPPAAGLSLGVPPATDSSADPLLLTRIDMDWLAEQWRQPLLPWALYQDSPANNSSTLTQNSELQNSELTSQSALQQDWQPRYLPAARHRGYALQWAGLSFAALAIFVVLSWRQFRSRRSGAQSTTGGDPGP